mmetsp:Transcript_8746/g.25452  ORF Transcript_8746/g.25452 Transcript_8746/m.25452 type:complete len:80 (+) Transcript_8746:725-964(+)
MAAAGAGDVLAGGACIRRCLHGEWSRFDGRRRQSTDVHSNRYTGVEWTSFHFQQIQPRNLAQVKGSFDTDCQSTMFHST